MEWITGMQRAIDYIEAHLTEKIDYEQAAQECFSSVFHFQRIFSIFFGYTLGEYIRCRRLSLAGTELAAGKGKVIDIAAKYGYESPDSFAKAFRRFHGITPSQACGNGTMLKSFSRLSINISMEGGYFMNYRIEEKAEQIYTGFKHQFQGTPDTLGQQDEKFILKTRVNQLLLQALARDLDTTYNILTNYTTNTFDYYIAFSLSPSVRANLSNIIGSDLAACFEHITVPSGQYLVCETDKCLFPTDQLEDLRRKAVSQWLPSSGYILDDRPEVHITHWFIKNPAENATRYCEVWLPIYKK